MARFPQLPERLRAALDANFMGFYAWVSEMTRFFQVFMSTEGDITFSTAGKGIVLKNAAGTVTKRVRLNDAGDGIIFEDAT